MGMLDKIMEFDVEPIENAAQGIAYLVELVTFMLFIYEEALQINNSMVLQAAKRKDKNELYQLMANTYDPAINSFTDCFIKWGLIAIYINNAYASFLYASMMCREVGNFAMGKGRLDYEFPRVQY